MTHLVLIGGGHAHVAVLSALAGQSLPNLHLTVISPQAYQTYSGMLPGWLAGHYSLEECQINLAPLVAAAQGELILDKVIRLDANQQCLETASGQTINYDLLSINSGSETALPTNSASNLIPIRPLERLLTAWPHILNLAQQDNYQLAVLGGGAAGIELALAIQYAFQQKGTAAQVHLIAPKLLADHAPSVQQRVQRQLTQAGVKVHSAKASIENGVLFLETGEAIQANQIIAATGAKAPTWLTASGLAVDSQGYIAVNAQHQSCSHPNVFAAGDCSAREDLNFGRSGVHAVYAGKVLAHNLPTFINQQSLQSYHPKKHSLYLLATGPKHAIASWGTWSASGTWVWHWKNHIDQSFMRHYRMKTSPLLNPAEQQS
ncbi:MAG TPA: FAD-dependent oxidoreductase [Thiolinea sp.]|nr:FAD-dependent oxidoreductase [Thiolinea sp.]